MPDNLATLGGTAVGTPSTVERTLAMGRRAPREARTIVRSALDRRTDRVDDAALLVTELVTNVVRKGCDSALLRIEVQPAWVRITVSDQGVRFRWTPPDDSSRRGSGYGLQIVDTLADRWGVSDDPTSVWFEMDRRTEA